MDRVDQHEFDLTYILDLWQPSDVLVVGDAHNQGLRVVHPIHRMSLNSEMSTVSWDLPAMPASYMPEESEAIPRQAILDADKLSMIDPAAT